MGMMISVRDVQQLDLTVWKARLSPQEIRILGTKPLNYGNVSILLLSGHPSFDKEKGILHFSPTNVRVLNLGSSPETIIVEANPTEIIPPQKGLMSPNGSLNKGDAHFIKELPPSLKQLGAGILHAVRADFPGELKLSEAGKYIETPDNFWTIRPQGRDQSFRITVRGTPESFDSPKSLVLKPDMHGYSSFKVSNSSQIEELISILHKVRKK